MNLLFALKMVIYDHVYYYVYALRISHKDAMNQPYFNPINAE